jgi:hypothetical protein
MQGAGGLLLSFFIQYCIYVSHTHLNENRTPLCEKESPLAQGCIRAYTLLNADAGCVRGYVAK